METIKEFLKITKPIFSVYSIGEDNYYKNDKQIIVEAIIQKIAKFSNMNATQDSYNFF